MKVFLGWSGETSHNVAIALHDWLPLVIQSVKPWVSSEDIEKGARWSTDIAKELQGSNFGIICVTKDNVGSPWINFEAGALSKEIEKANVSPFLFNLSPSEVSGPLAQFQHVVNEKGDVWNLLDTINKKEEAVRRLETPVLQKAFDAFWPQLEAALHRIANEESVRPSQQKREVRAMMEELLDLSRSLARDLEGQRLRDRDALHSLRAELMHGLDESRTIMSALARSVEGLHNEVDPFRMPLDRVPVWGGPPLQPATLAPPGEPPVALETPSTTQRRVFLRRRPTKRAAAQSSPPAAPPQPPGESGPKK